MDSRRPFLLWRAEDANDESWQAFSFDAERDLSVTAHGSAVILQPCLLATRTMTKMQETSDQD